MPAESVDLVVTSPPYDDLRTYGGHSWDFPLLASELTRVLKPGGVIVWVVADATVNGSETLTSMRQAIHFKDVCGLNVHDTMIYKKSAVGACGSNLAYWQEWEYAFVMAKGRPEKVNRLKDRKNSTAGSHRSPTVKQNAVGTRKHGKVEIAEQGVRGNVWTYHTGNFGGDDAHDHPAPFPQALASDHIQSWSNPGDVVLDPFAGSGTTLKAAKELGRRFVGIEINPEYVDICHRRLAQEVLNLFPDNAKGMAAGAAVPPLNRD
jgi:site-specific DNA-methyltransferase (adenine-specific)